jgi:hypothetical protein
MNLRLSRGWILVGAWALLAGLFLAGRRAEHIWPGEKPDKAERLAAEEEKRCEEIRDRLEQKGHIARKVISGQLTLLEAAHRYQELDESGSPFSWDTFRVVQDGATDEERHCREVVDWVEVEAMETDPCVALALRARLLRELEKWKAQGKSK